MMITITTITITTITMMMTIVIDFIAFIMQFLYIYYSICYASYSYVSSPLAHDRHNWQIPQDYPNTAYTVMCQTST